MLCRRYVSNQNNFQAILLKIFNKFNNSRNSYEVNLCRFGLTLLLLIGKNKSVSSVSKYYPILMVFIYRKAKFWAKYKLRRAIFLQVYLLMGCFFRRFGPKNSNHMVTLPVSSDGATNIDRMRQNIKPSSGLSPF